MNGRGLVGVSHHEAVEVLKEAGNDIKMVIGRRTTRARVLSQPPARTRSSTSRPQRTGSAASDTVPSPQPAVDGVVLRRPGVATSPTRLSTNHSVSPERPPSARLSGSVSPSYEVDSYSHHLLELSYIVTLC